MAQLRSFASDNTSGAHPEVLEALIQANSGHARSYGHDDTTAQADAILRSHLGPTAQPFYVLNGTGANVLCLRALAASFEAVVCSEMAHINTDECGAPEANAGCKLLPIHSPDGRLTPEMIRPYLAQQGNEHRVQPRVVSITQPTEVGVCYSPDEIATIADFCHANSLLLHMDGARLANACAHLDCSMSAITSDLGVDALSLGGTKNGLALGEAVVLFNPDFAARMHYVRKQSMQLASKMRFVSAQFAALFGSDLWLRSAKHANAMAARLADAVKDIPGLSIAHPVHVNAVFATLPSQAVAALQEQFYFYTWQEHPQTPTVRWMCSFNTTADEVDAFVAAVRATM